MTADERFVDAQARVKALKAAPQTSDLLALYALYKQASIGDATGERPGMFDMKGRAKFDAWAKLKGKPRADAMEAYVALVDRLAAA